jgi:hypothetical protein
MQTTLPFSSIVGVKPGPSRFQMPVKSGLPLLSVGVLIELDSSAANTLADAKRIVVVAEIVVTAKQVSERIVLITFFSSP